MIKMAKTDPLAARNNASSYVQFFWDSWKPFEKAELATRADRAKDCVLRANHGQCKKYPGYMLKECAKSCRNVVHQLSIKANKIAKEWEGLAKFAKTKAD